MLVVLVAQSCNSLQPLGLQPTRLSSPEDLPDPGIEPGSLAVRADSLSSELYGMIYIKHGIMHVKPSALGLTYSQ